MNKFEKKLQQQPLRPIPPDWRADILAAARATQPTPPVARAMSRSLLATINQQLSTLLWPHPKAWAGLAAVWVGIFALNLGMQERAPVRAGKAAPASPEMVVEWRKQQKLFAELMGTPEAHEADRPRVYSPRPRSERVEVLMT